MNRFQQAMPPGSPEARRSYCICSSTPDIHINVETGEVEAWTYIDPDCPLHSNKPEHRLPPSI